MKKSGNTECVTVSVAEGIATITIANGEFNLLDAKLVVEVFATLSALLKNDHIRMVVFESGIDDYFLSHADFGAVPQAQTEQHYKRGEFPRYSQFLEWLRKYPKVTVGVIRGRATGGGLELAMALDMCFADIERAKFALMEIVLGILPGGGGNQYLVRKVGRSRALEICLSGRDFSAVEAERYGVVNRALRDADLNRYLSELTGLIASHSLLSIDRNKAAINLIDDRLSQDFVANNDLFVDLAEEPEFKRRIGTFISSGGQTTEGEMRGWSHWARELS